MVYFWFNINKRVVVCHGSMVWGEPCNLSVLHLTLRHGTVNDGTVIRQLSEYVGTWQCLDKRITEVKLGGGGGGGRKRSITALSSLF